MAPNIDEVVERARRRLVRVTPEQASAELAQGALLVDTRTESQRAVQGEIPGSIVIDRTVLEWRLDPTSPSRRTWNQRLPGPVLVSRNPHRPIALSDRLASVGRWPCV